MRSSCGPSRRRSTTLGPRSSARKRSPPPRPPLRLSPSTPQTPMGSPRSASGSRSRRARRRGARAGRALTDIAG
eukprot:3454746-Alexandrium_andersonii.AAC.1